MMTIMKNLNKQSPEVRAAVLDLLADLDEMAKARPLAIERVARLFEAGPRTQTMTQLLIGILPDEGDPRIWLEWLEAGRASGTPTPADPEKDRKISARGAQQSATNRFDEATRKVAELEDKLAAAKVERDERLAEVKEADNHLRMVVIYRLILTGVLLAEAPFSMGPMWTVARSISRHLRQDVAYESTLDPTEVAALEEHRAHRKETSARILELLDFYCGDVALEVKLHTVMLETLEAHHKPVQTEIDNRNIDRKPLSAIAKRVKRRSEERRAGIRPGAPISDRHEVLDGLSTTAVPTDTENPEQGGERI